MLSFDKLIIHNFGSYGHAELNLRNKGFCLVTGKNDYKKDNALSNGSGKSFLWNAICFALCGETINGLHTNLKNINILDEPDCWVQLFFTYGADNFEITRYISPRSDLKIIKNNIDVSGKGIRESEKKLAELLPDITKNLITSIIIIGQGMPNRFSSFSPCGRKELLEKLTKADFMIEDIKQRVSNRQHELKQQLRAQEDNQIAINTQLHVYTTTLEQQQKQLASMIKPNFAAQISSEEQKLQKIYEQKKILEERLSVEEQAANISANNQVQAISAKATELEAARKKYETDSHDYLQKYHILQADLKAVNREIEALSNVRDTCPTCGQKLPGCHKPDVSAQQAKVAELTSEILTIEAVLKEHEAVYTAATSEITKQHDLNIKFLSEDATVRRQEISNLRLQYKAILTEENASKSLLNQLNYESANWEANYKSLQDAVLQVTSTVTDLTAKIASVNEAVTELTEHLKIINSMDNLLKRDFRGFLLTNIIQYLNKKAKEYSSIVFGTHDLELSLDGNNLNISYCGKMFDNLSGGEKQRVDLIMQFTIRSMLTAYLNFNSNILVLDEITDFLDKKSCAAILELITKELNTIESVFIVSHHASALELPIDSELVIKKNELGISEIISGV